MKRGIAMRIWRRVDQRDCCELCGHWKTGHGITRNPAVTVVATVRLCAEHAARLESIAADAGVTDTEWRAG